ncbi:MAG TPA: hypothetical protein VGY97_05060 [Solirubrobacteraceae bacterium]|nr:hypothetical protein [Solirubrobacteraceae bacterium]
MRTRAEIIRNVAVVVALAAAVWALPAGGQAASIVGSVLGVLFAIGLAIFGARMYLEHRMSIYALDERYRALLYGAIAVAFLTLAATSKLWASSTGTFAWVLLLAASAFALATVYRVSRRY